MEVVSNASMPPTADMDMDIDIDIELDPIQTELPTISDPFTPSEPPQVLPVTLYEELVANKLHLQGVDDLTTSDITAFADEYFPEHSPKVEWINDSSLNLQYETTEIAREALNAFTLEALNDHTLHSLQLRATKPLTGHPNSQLQVRTSVVSDRKKPRAREASRFYLNHPEYDPLEKRRRGSGEYRRRKYGAEEHRRRRRDDDQEGFAASMYDDDAGAVAGRGERRNSRSSISSDGHSHANSYRIRRARNRSASPARNEGSTSRRLRRRTPPPDYSLEDPNPSSRSNIGKELFVKDIGAELRESRTQGKELFPNKSAVANTKKELFPTKTTSGHRRSVAFDAADETANLFASRMSVPFHDASQDDGRLRMTDPDPDPDTMDKFEDTNGGISIRGAATAQATNGFAIRGTAAKVKELFPEKAGNAGKELFSNRMQARGGVRTKAADHYF